MATHSIRIVHYDEKRHKCNKCGAVRYESYMRKASHMEIRVVPQFGNDLKCWLCKKHDREK